MRFASSDERLLDRDRLAELPLASMRGPASASLKIQSCHALSNVFVPNAVVAHPAGTNHPSYETSSRITLSGESSFPANRRSASRAPLIAATLNELVTH